jgi:hypothetical protein
LKEEIILIAWLSVSINWDYDRFVESSIKRSSGKFFEQAHLGRMTRPTTVLDMHGKILMWYLPGLLLPHRVVRSSAPVQNILFLLTLRSGRVE